MFQKGVPARKFSEYQINQDEVFLTREGEKR